VQDPALAAAVMSEVITVLNPAPDSTALVQNPRIRNVESTGLAEFNGDQQHKAFDLAFRCASTGTRDRAYHFVHSACRIGDIP
jgi:hypothetical protein